MTNQRAGKIRLAIVHICNEQREKLALAEWTAGIAAVGIAIYLHVVRLQHAGGLWRDEVATLNAAMAPTLSELWARLSYEIMPGFSLLVIRAWSLTGAGGTDFGLRVYGLIVGLCAIGALWLNGRLCGYHIPFVSIGLLGFSPLLIATVDSIRPYGLALVLILVTVGVTLKALQSSEPKWIAVSALLSILSVQCAYGNACLVFGTCIGAIAVSAYRRDWKRLIAFTAVGAAAALSLIPYIGHLNRISEWAIVVQSPSTILDLLGNLGLAMGSPQLFMIFVWVWSASLAVYLVRQNADQKKGNESNEREGDAVLFACVALPVSAAAYFLWLWVSRYINPWHYLLLLAVTAVYLEIILSLLVKSPAARVFRLTVFAVVVAFSALLAWYQVQVRQTNIDTVANIITERAEPNDLIVLNPWYIGISFQRYYTGTVALTAVPPMGIVTTHRYDLLKRKMTSENPLETLMDQIEDTLRNGHRVWITGSVFPGKGQKPSQLPPAPQSGIWDNEVYKRVWWMQVAYFIQACAMEIETITVDGYDPVSPYENVSLFIVSGWRGNKNK